MGDAPPKYSPFNGHDDEKVVGFGGCPIFGQAHVNLKVAIGGFEPTIFVTPQNGHDMEKRRWQAPNSGLAGLSRCAQQFGEAMVISVLHPL